MIDKEESTDQGACKRCVFAIALDECLVIEQSGTSIALRCGDFLVFDDNNTLLALEKEDFHLRFRHADGRGSYVFLDKDSHHTNYNKEQTASSVLNISEFNSYECKEYDGATISTEPMTITLNNVNASKWIQRTTTLAFYLKAKVSITKKSVRSGSGLQYKGERGDVMVIHACGILESIISENAFQNCFSFLKTDETEASVTIALDDDCRFKPYYSHYSGGPARLPNEHPVEIKRLHPIYARKMKESFVAHGGADGRWINYGRAGDYLVQEMDNTARKRASSLATLPSLSSFSLSTLPNDFDIRGNLSSEVTLKVMGEEGEVTYANKNKDENTCEMTLSNKQRQWVLTSLQIHALFIRIEEEKVNKLADIGSIDEDKCDVEPIVKEESANTFSSSPKQEYLLMPTDAFLPHYKCWEGILHKRTKITRCWKAVFATLYPNRLVLGKYFPIKEVPVGAKEDDLYDLPEDYKTPVKTFSLAYCSIHPSVVNKKVTLFVENMQSNVATQDGDRDFKPYTDVRKAASPNITSIASFLSISKQDANASASKSNGCYLSSPTLCLDTLSALLNSAVLYSRRDMCLSATKSGNAARVIQILLSVSPTDALSILQTLCPIGSSPGMLIQHEAAKTSLELTKALFPLTNNPSYFSTLFHADLDIFAFSSSGFMCLHYAVLADNMAIVAYLLENKTFNLSTNTLTRNGSTTLHLAKSKELTLYLLNNGASTSIANDDGHTPLMSLITFGGYEAATTFLDYASVVEGSISERVMYDINAKSWRTGLSALSFAIKTLNDKTIAIVKALLVKGADPNSRDLKNNSCLHEAVYLFNTLSKGFAFDESAMHADTVVCLELIKLLIQAGADIHQENDEGMTPFLLICHAECFQKTTEAEQIVDLLTTSPTIEENNYGDEDDLIDSVLDSRSADGSCPLHNVIRQSNSVLLEYLINKGANVNSTDINGNTPLDLVHAAQANIDPCTPLHVVQQMMQCLNLLTNNKALRRLRKNIPMEVDQSTIKFVSSSSHVGLYEVKSATLKSIIDRLCSEIYYNDNDAEALVFSFKSCERSSCDIILDMIASNYPEKSNGTTLLIDEKDVVGGADFNDSSHKNNNDNGDCKHTTSSMESIITRTSRKGSGFTDARENSPGGLLLLLRAWFDLNPKSIDLTNVRFVKTLKNLASKLLEDYPRALSTSSRRLFSATLDEEFDVQDLVDGFRCVMAAPIVSLRRGLSSLQHNADCDKQLGALLLNFDLPNWSVKAFSLLGVEASSVFRLRNYQPLHIAQQASCMQHYLHKLIGEDEILSLKYSDPDLCPNIHVLRKWNDNVANCFASEILSENTPKKRADVICHLLDIAFQSLEAMNNFELLVIILGVLECTAIYRLKLTWQCVEKKHPGRRKKFKDIVGIGGRNVRSLMQNTQPPLVPYLGVYMQQMINLHEMPSKYELKGCAVEHINMSKFRNILKVLHEHNKSQAKYFNLRVNEEIQKCLRKPTILCTEDLLLRMSAELEPNAQ